MLIVDGHLDLAYNAMDWNRDIAREAAEIRLRESAMADRRGRALGTVCLPSMRQGGVFLTLAPVQARIQRPGTPPGYRSPQVAHAVAKGYFHYYRALAARAEIRLIRTRDQLASHLADWQGAAAWERGGAVRLPIGVVVTMEGADPILHPEQVWEWQELGVRVVSLSHFGPSTYAHGTGTPGGLFPPARALLREMRAAGIILDTTHLAEQAFWEAMDLWDGPVVATHQNARALVPGDRQFSDAMLKELARRGAVIGHCLDCWQLSPGWDPLTRDNLSERRISLEDVANQVDHLCQLAGSAAHSAIGSDLDGNFGRQNAPYDLDTIADLQRIAGILARRGYGEADVAQILHGNWLRLLEAHLP